MYNEEPLIGSLLTSGTDMMLSGSYNVRPYVGKFDGKRGRFAAPVQGACDICAKLQAWTRSLYVFELLPDTLLRLYYIYVAV